MRRDKCKFEKVYPRSKEKVSLAKGLLEGLLIPLSYQSQGLQNSAIDMRVVSTTLAWHHDGILNAYLAYSVHGGTNHVAEITLISIAEFYRACD